MEVDIERECAWSGKGERVHVKEVEEDGVERVD